MGFRPANCLALVDVCRDELMSGFDDHVARIWGRPFKIGALGAMVLAGVTGIQAALGHVPGEDGRYRFVVFAFPHIGVDSGVLGRVQRRRMSRASIACGAIAAARTSIAATTAALDPDDVEQSLLCMRLASILEGGPVPSLLDLTELARRAAVEDIGRFVELARHQEPVDVAYLSGIVVHAPDGMDRVARVEAVVRIDSDVVLLPH